MKLVLAVEADPVVRLALQKVLGRHGWWVEAAQSVGSALQFLDYAPCHAIWRSIPVVMLHSDAEPSASERAFEFGATEFLSRQLSEDAALRTLERWVLICPVPERFWAHERVS